MLIVTRPMAAQHGVRLVMTTRREINPLHEAAVVKAAVNAHNARFGCGFIIIDKPDPPDAILQDGERQLWLEHTDAFYPGWARDLTTFAASDKSHVPMDGGLHANMDQSLAEVFCSVVRKKLDNPAYVPLVRDLGPGILVVGLESPWLSDETIEAISRAWLAQGDTRLNEVFSHVYLGFRQSGDNHAVSWQPT